MNTSRSRTRTVLVLIAGAVLILGPISLSEGPCTAPAHGIVPAESIDGSPGGQLRWLLDHGYQGDIYDAHAHLFAVPETSLLPSLTDPPVDRFVIEPMSIADQLDAHLFYLSEHLHIRGFVNLALPNLGGLGDPSCTYEWRGGTYPMAYVPAKPGSDPGDDNLMAFAGNVYSASALYTKFASFDPASGRHRVFAYTGLDWADIRAGVLDGSIASVEDVKARLAARIRRFREIGFDGLKFVSEWSAGRNGKWGAARNLVLLETLDASGDPWALDGEMFNGPGGIFDIAVEVGFPVVVHGGDGGANTEAFWAPGGLWDRILDAHPGLELQIAHGHAIGNLHKGRPHEGADAEACDQVFSWMVDLFDRHDGSNGGAMVRIDMGSLISVFAEHNSLHRSGASAHDIRQILIDYDRHFLLGLDPINQAARTYQTEGCGAIVNPIESQYLGARVKLEGPFVEGNPKMQYLDLIGEGDTLDRIYRENLFEQLGEVSAVDVPLAIDYIEELIASVNTEYRGTTPETDPLVAALSEILAELSAGLP